MSLSKDQMRRIFLNIPVADLKKQIIKFNSEGRIDFPDIFLGKKKTVIVTRFMNILSRLPKKDQDYIFDVLYHLHLDTDQTDENLVEKINFDIEKVQQILTASVNSIENFESVWQFRNYFGFILILDQNSIHIPTFWLNYIFRKVFPQEDDLSDYEKIHKFEKELFGSCSEEPFAAELEEEYGITRIIFDLKKIYSNFSPDEIDFIHSLNFFIFLLENTMKKQDIFIDIPINEFPIFKKLIFKIFQEKTRIWYDLLPIQMLDKLREFKIKIIESSYHIDPWS